MIISGWLKMFAKKLAWRRRFSKTHARKRLRFGHQVELMEDRTLLAAAPFPEFVDPNPAAGNNFGATIIPLSTGNVLITSPFDDAGGTDAGAVYLFDGATGDLISALRGSSDYDYVGRDGVTVLDNGNFVVTSPYWNNGGVEDAGAVTFGSGVTGVNGPVNASNSLVGGTQYDYVGNNGVTELGTGNYVVRSSIWDNGAIADAGAVTFGSGLTGVTGVVSSSNSLVGASANDQAGSSALLELSSGNYLVTTLSWDNGGATDAGAVTFASGSAGITGVVGASNSLVGSTANDGVGSQIVELTNGNYIVVTPTWDNAGTPDAGAVTWGDGTSGISGVVSSSNSLVGATANDRVGGYGIMELSSGNYLVKSFDWDNGAAVNAGAVTWGDGSTGVSGVLDSTNSLVGSTTDDRVGSSGIVELTNGNYLVLTNNWDNGAAVNAGAVTFGDGAAGVAGEVGSANSLVGTSSYDYIGYGGITELSTGNYVVTSTDWSGDMGAVTFGDGTSGVAGEVSAANSLIGSTAGDVVGNGGITELTNGNYIVKSSNWDNGGIVNAGAVTWADGTNGTAGVVSPANSLVGSTASDAVGNGGITVLSNGNYVVRSVYWDNGGTVDAGAVTWGDGTNGTTVGVVNAANSLVGSTTYDRVGYDGITVLGNGNYIVRSSTYWNNDAVVDAGAVTWGDGTNGTTVGVVSAANSLVGSTAYDRVGYYGITVLSNGNYVVSSNTWDNGAATDAGAVTFGDGANGTTFGVVSAANSLVGTTTYDYVGNGGITELSTGNYVVRTTNWNNGTATYAGAVTFGDASSGVVGEVSSSNSLVGTSSYDYVGNGGITELSNGNYVVISTDWSSDRGAVTFGDGTSGVAGEVSAANSLVGSTSGDVVGNGGITQLTNGNYVVRSPYWSGTAYRAGAATWGSGATGVSGIVSASNSLIGSSAYDSVGSIYALPNGNYVVVSYSWDNGTAANAGAVTWGDGSVGTAGVVNVTNSLVGSTYNDQVGAYGITVLSNGNYLVRSLNWSNGVADSAGAVTFASGTMGITGVVSANNSLVGSSPSDGVGNGGIIELENGNYVVRSPNWDNGAAVYAGAATWGDGNVGVTGVVSGYNSLIGQTSSTNLGNIIEDSTNDTFFAPFATEFNGKVRVRSRSPETFGDPTAPVVDGTQGDDQFTISRDGADVVIVRNDVEVVRELAATMTSITIYGGLGDDELTINFTGDLDLPIHFDGQEHDTTGDTLVLMGGAGFADAIYNYDNANDGSIQLTGQGLITYNGLEPITASINAVNVTLNYSDAAETIQVFDAGFGQTTVDSTFGELTTFNNPTGTLTINAGDVGKNTINVEGLAASYSASIDINGGNAGDTVSLLGTIAFAADRSLAVDAMTIHVPNSTSDIATSGTGAIDLNATRNITLSPGSSLTTEDGGISLTANAAKTESGAFIGIDANGALIQSTGEGNIDIDGTGGSDASAASLIGVYLHDGTTVQSTQMGGVSATITVFGRGGSGTQFNSGIVISGATTSVGVEDGYLQINGNGGTGLGDHNDGVLLSQDAQIQIGNGGWMSLAGTAYSGYSSGVRLHEGSGGQIVSQGLSAINILASGSGGADSLVAGSNSVIGGPAATFDIHLYTDSIALSGTTVVQSTGELAIIPPKSTSIGLGGGVGTLNLTDAELALLHDGFSSITIGNAINGTGSVDIDTATFLDPVTIAGGVIHDHAGTDVVAPQVTLVGDVSPGQSPGTLVVDGDFSFANDGSYAVEIGEGNFDQTNVAGGVTIGANVALNLSSWDGYVPTGEDYVIINNDDVDAVAGTFLDLPEGTALNDFLGSGLTYRITYAGGDGNDVVLVADPVNDMPADIVGRLGGDWWIAESNGTNAFTSDYYGSWGDLDWQNTQIGDFNGDGRTDVASQLDGTWYVGLSNGDVFTQEVWGYWDTGVVWNDVMVADVDGDGDSDIVGRTDAGGWWVARSNGSSFTNEAWGYWSSSTSWQNVMVADVDGDGAQDIVGRESNGNWWVARSNGVNSFATQYWGYWVTSVGWNDVMVADVDGDGDSDIVGRTDSGGWWVARSNGVNTFTNESWGYWVPTAGWQDVLVADVNGDGHDDIVGRESVGNIWVALSDGTGSFTTAYWGYWVPSAGWQDVLVADVNQDGNADLVGRESNGFIWVAKSNGVDGFVNELWGAWSTGDWQDVAGFSSGTTAAATSAFVPSLLDEEEDMAVFFV